MRIGHVLVYVHNRAVRADEHARMLHETVVIQQLRADDAPPRDVAGSPAISSMKSGAITSVSLFNSKSRSASVLAAPKFMILA